MNLKMILSMSLLVLIGLGIVTFGYTVYAIYQTNAPVLTTHVIPLALQSAIEVMQLVLAGIAVYKT